MLLSMRMLGDAMTSTRREAGKKKWRAARQLLPRLKEISKEEVLEMSLQDY